jgi:hypothetical protein
VTGPLNLARGAAPGLTATDPGPQTNTCQADGTPCCEPTGVLCVTAPAQVSAGEIADYRVGVTNTSSQPISGHVYAQIGSTYQKLGFNNLAPGATDTGKMKWRAVAGQWPLTFYTHVNSWADEPWLTILQPVT